MTAPRPLAALPGLEELAANPQRATDLTPEAARALLPRCSQELTRLSELRGMLLIAAFANGTARRDTSDRFLDADAVAAKISKSRSWVEEHPDDLPARRRVGGRGALVRARA